MKRTICLFCLISLLACEKYPFLPDEYSETILGNWQWVWTGCWNSGYYLSADTADYTLKMTFNRKGKYYEYKNDTLILSSKYWFDLAEDHNGYKTYRLTIDKTNEKFCVLLMADTLTLMEYKITDSCEKFYIKQK